MGRLIGLISLLFGLGLTAYYSSQERGLRGQPVTVVGGEVRAMDGDPIPTPRP
jgi:hypothetical protein